MRERSDMSLQLRERETEILTLQAQVRYRYYAVLAPPFYIRPTPVPVSLIPMSGKASRVNGKFNTETDSTGNTEF